MKRFLAFLLFVFFTGALAQVAVPPVARVTDQTGTLKSEQKAALEQLLAAFEQRKGSQIAVLMVPTTRPEQIEQYAIRVAEAWKLGRKGVDDGALLVVAKDDRAVRIEVGYGLEGALNDATANRIVEDVVVPRFREGDFYGGISAGVDRMIRVIDGEPLPAPQRRAPGNAQVSGGFFQLLPMLLVGTLLVGGVLSAFLGRTIGSFATAGVVGFLAWLLAGTLFVGILAGVLALFITVFNGTGGRGGSTIGLPGGYYGGRRGGWGGRGGGFGGGFGGGGGGFGGGGASGRW